MPVSMRSPIKGHYVKSVLRFWEGSAIMPSSRDASNREANGNFQRHNFMLKCILASVRNFMDFPFCLNSHPIPEAGLIYTLFFNGGELNSSKMGLLLASWKLLLALGHAEDIRDGVYLMIMLSSTSAQRRHIRT